MMAFAIPTLVASADEGMYLFNEVPKEALRKNYDFSPDQAWYDHLRLSSVRFNNGGSGSFVSSRGLVLTNHHVASDTLQKLSSPEQNLIRDGFLASGESAEIPAPDLELNQLVEIVDVTDRVRAAVDDESDDETAAEQRRAALSTIEKESLDQTGLRSDVVKLYGGAKYHLYRYKKYTDVRLVWAPETAAAFFGGDADNFEYPRFNLDATLFRVYEDGQPANLEHYLRWSDTNIAEGDLVFVSGHPGRTQRLFTVAALKYLRDRRMPYVLNYLRRKEVLLQQYSLGGVEAKRRARDELFGIQNARKAYTGMLAGLQTPDTMNDKSVRENRQVEMMKSSGIASDPIGEIAEVQKLKSDLLDQGVTLRSRLFDIALQIVLLSQENSKPDTERLREYTEARRESLLQDLLSPAPIYKDLETAKLADELSLLVERRGGDDPFIRDVLGDAGPADFAGAAVAQTRLDDVEYRQTLVDGTADTVEASNDPMITLAKSLVGEYRRVRKLNEALDEREINAYAELAKLPPAGGNVYPDATFSLRLAFGTVKGYSENGRTIPPTTNFGGAFEHAASHAGQDDFDLPESWMNAKAKLDLSTQLNFVCTADIIGGNSGSPVVDRQGQLVGLIFDGNIQSLISDYAYTDKQGRAVSVAGTGIRHALDVIYDASELAEELGH